MQRIVHVGLLLVLLLLGCSNRAATVEVYFVRADGSTSPTVRAELARTAGEVRLGLMYRKSLGEFEGMVFIFPEEAPRSFWMKNTYVELDIIYLNKDKKVVSIVKRALPLSETARPSGVPAQYVVEVRGGSADAWGIVPGAELRSSAPLQ